jgi:ectoine hydroxylase-related dioxygenase (phytanoyl-CoA dioxygenase family)
MHHGGSTGCHMDRVYMNRGSQELLTCWIPFDHLTLDMSVLAVLEGSHRMDRPEYDTYTKLQHTYADMDVDRDKLRGTGWFTEDPMEFYHFNDAFDQNLPNDRCISSSSPMWKTAGNFI